MFVNLEKKALFLENPKTGSTVLRVAYNTHHKAQYIRPHTHTELAQLDAVFEVHYPEYDHTEFKKYAFARDPIERAVSGWRYALQQWESSRTQSNPDAYRMYDNMADVILTPEEKEAKVKLEVTFDQYLMLIACGCHFPTSTLTHEQTRFMDADTRVLSYLDFAEGVKEVADVFDIPNALLPDGTAQSHNVSDAVKYRDSVTPMQRSAIKALYHKDYMFFMQHKIEV